MMEWIKTGSNVPWNAYADFPARGLYQGFGKDGLVLWFPCYIQLLELGKNEDFVPAAKALRKLLRKGSKDIRAPEHTYRQIARILEEVDDPDGNRQAGNPARARMFVYRRVEADEDLALPYSALLDGETIFARVLAVGPAIPGGAPTKIQPGALVLPIDERSASEAPLIVGVIDDEIGFLNQRFREPDDTKATRIAHFWSMSLEDFGGGPQVGFGKHLSKRDIDGQLEMLDRDKSEAELYADFDATKQRPKRPIVPGPFRDPALRRPRQLIHSHGTAVLDLAAGGTGDRILAAELPQLATAQTHGGLLDVYILHAAVQLLDWADTLVPSKDFPDKTEPQPIVVNISYATHAGPKDGTGLLERELARLAKYRVAPTKFVLTSGNNYRSLGRAQFTQGDNLRQNVTWRVQPDDASLSFLELHADAVTGGAFFLEVPGVDELEMPLDEKGSYLWLLVDDARRPTKMHAAAYVSSDGHCRADAVVALMPTRPHADPWQATVPSGAYRLGLSREVLDPQAPPMQSSIEVQRDDSVPGYATGARQSYLDDKFVDEPDPKTGRRDLPGAHSAVTREGTLSAFATADSRDVFVVGGAYGLPDADGDIVPTLYASAGFEHLHPDLAAVSEEGRVHGGHIATGLYSGSSTIIDGTSAAAPLVTRKILERGSIDGEEHQIMDDLLNGGTSFKHTDSRLGRGVVKARDPDAKRLLP